LFRLAESFNIGPQKKIGGSEPCFIIAEAGSNHNRDLKLAFKLIDIAFEANADAVKFQTFTAETIASDADTDLSKIDFAGAKSLFELYKNLELPREWQKDLFSYAKEKGITFLSTPFDEKAVDELFQIGVEAFKIASFEITHFPLLRHVAQTDKPVLLSTGMATLGEIEEAVEVLFDAGCDKIGLFHCGIGYPMKMEDVNLRAMDTMSHVFRCPVGYSDHTLGIEVPVAAVARGASMIEKHFTVGHELPGPDHGFALEPKDLMAMVSGIRIVEKALGSYLKGPAESELLHKKRGCRSLYAKKAIPKGTVITEDMVSVLRPGAGLHPRNMATIIGRRVVRDICQNEPLTWDCLIE
jgi:sialic acid synthase SpsE